MGIIRQGQPVEPSPFCICIPPLYLTVGIGTVWECDRCGRWFERVTPDDPRSRGGAAWVKIRGAVR